MPTIRETWWQSPRRAADRIANRRVSFLELFYDLVFVAIISQVEHRLTAHLDGSGVFVFAGMFTIIWWAWFNGSMYHDLHGNDDVRTRTFTFLQMIAVAAMAVFAHDAVGESSRQFAIAYAALQLILAFLWFMTGVKDPDHRLLSFPYTINMLVSIAIFVASVFVPEEIRYTLWLIAIVIAMIGPQVATAVIGANRPEVRDQVILASRASESVVERFGLFGIIVLGEVIVGVVGGVIARHHVVLAIAAAALVGMVIAIALWWIYFDLVSMQMPRPGFATTYGWMWLHLPLTMSIAAVGAGILHVVELSPGTPQIGPRLILGGAVAVAALSIAMLSAILEGSELHQQIRRASRRVLLVVAPLSIVLSIFEIGAIALLSGLALLLLSSVVAGFYVLHRHLMHA